MKRRRCIKIARWCLVALVALLPAVYLARVELLARSIVTSMNRGKTAEQLGEVAPEQWRQSARDQAVRIAVGPPDASLSAFVFDPERPEPRGTILLLHGIHDQKMSLVGLAHGLAGRGFRTVAVDLRGHGRSTGDWLSYGVIESHDLSQVLDALDARGLLTKHVGIYGGSYGAATAIQTAALDPRIEAVVAVASFSSLREIVSDYFGKSNWRVIFTERDFDRGLARAGALAGFDPALCDVSRALARTQAQVLLLHGSDDVDISPAHAQRNFAASHGNAELVMLSGVDHATIFDDQSGELWRCTTGWFDRWWP